MIEPLLFVYGTLRSGHSGPEAAWLRAAARHIGPAVTRGLLYRIADYPGFIPGPCGNVVGDLFALHDPAAALARLDDYEECSDRFPTPHEYRRELRTVMTPHGPATAWAYVYAWDISGQEPIAGGDFLA